MLKHMMEAKDNETFTQGRTMIEFIPLKKLTLPPKIQTLIRTFKPYSFFKGGVAREALLTYFSRYDRAFKRVLDYDFIVFASDYEESEEWDHSLQEPYYVDRPVFTEEEDDEISRLRGLGDMERSSYKKDYFDTRDNTLNQVLLGKKGLYFTSEAKRDACNFFIGKTKDNRPRVVLRNLLLSTRLGHKPPKNDIQDALNSATLIDQIIPMLKAYKLGVYFSYYKELAKNNRTIARDQDPDLYFLRLLKEWEKKRGYKFNARENSEKRIIREIINRNLGL